MEKSLTAMLEELLELKLAKRGGPTAEDIRELLKFAYQNGYIEGSIDMGNALSETLRKSE